MSAVQSWKPEFYDHHQGFVSQFGKDLLGWLAPKRGEHILDLVFGTGDLTSEIAQAGSKVIGLDYSEEMILKAREKYPDINFQVGNGEQFVMSQPLDAVFSNAALHWMTNAPRVVESVWHALNNGGRFVAEFGGKGNVATIVQAIYDVLPHYGVDASKHNPWYFPSIAEYSHILEQQGFHVTLAEHFSRPTILPDGDQGLLHWLNQFSDSFFSALNDSDKQAAIHEINQLAKEKLTHGDTIIADYSRIRIMAFKP